jgi:hypothetical protein
MASKRTSSHLTYTFETAYAMTNPRRLLCSLGNLEGKWVISERQVH